LGKDTIAFAVARIWSLLRSPFSFLFTGSGKEDRVAAYIIREHGRGRDLDEILEDPYIRNRCTPNEMARVLERTDVIKAIGDDLAQAAKQSLPAA
jgi:hypothetical protein